MGKVERRIFLGVLAVLVAALCAMFLQGAADTGAPKVYHVTVLLDGAGEDYWQNFRTGINQAAQEENVDVRFVSRYEGDEGSAQAAALSREWAGEADGVVVVPVDGGLLTAAMQSAPAGKKLLAVGPGLGSDMVSCHVSADGGDMGGKLAQLIYDAGYESCAIYRAANDGVTAESRYAGLTAGLTELGVAYEDCSPEDAPPPEGALAALEPEVAEALCQREDAAGRVYGMGASNRLLNDMESGAVRALVIQSDYDAGYLSILRMVDALQGRTVEDVTLESYIVTAENMFADPIDQILFPIS